MKVYICRDPEHEKLLQTVKDILDRTRGKKPKLKVLQLKLKSSDEFPLWLRQIEELYGGVATAEFRKYGIESLPAVVYNEQLVMQGKVPTQEELEEALAYAGLKFTRKELTTIVQPPLQHRTLPERTNVMVARAPQAERAPASAQAERRSPPLPTRIPIVERLPPAEKRTEQLAKAAKIEEAPKSPPVEETTFSISSPSTRTQLVKPSSSDSVAAPSQAMVLTRPAQEGARPAAAAMPQPPQIEEIVVKAPLSTPSATLAQPKKSCRSCLFYDESTRKCVLYRVPISDPDEPACV